MLDFLLKVSPLRARERGPQPSAWKENPPNFVMTAFSEVHSESALGAKIALGIGASLVAAFLLDLRLRALRVEAQAG
jgi:hypothetical protein